MKNIMKRPIFVPKVKFSKFIKSYSMSEPSSWVQSNVDTQCVRRRPMVDPVGMFLERMHSTYPFLLI
jgi:hypothetical protein